MKNKKIKVAARIVQRVPPILRNANASPMARYMQRQSDQSAAAPRIHEEKRKSPVSMKKDAGEPRTTF
jgi:hypothetical protein